MTNAATADLEKMIPPAPDSVFVGGKNVEIKNMKVKQLSTVLKAVQPFIGAFTKANAQPDMLLLLINHTDNVTDLICALTGETQEWVGDLELDDLVVIFSKIVEVNLSFFTLRVFPSLSQAMGRLNVTITNPTQRPGLTSSSNSSAPDTDTTIS